MKTEAQEGNQPTPPTNIVSVPHERRLLHPTHAGSSKQQDQLAEQAERLAQQLVDREEAD